MFNVADCGCWADGAFGHDHVRAQLAHLIQQVPCGPSDKLLARTLQGEMSDAAYEEEEALKVLNDHCDGCYFELVDGDLMLIPDNEE